jgi:hypothetical protein
MNSSVVYNLRVDHICKVWTRYIQFDVDLTTMLMLDPRVMKTTGLQNQLSSIRSATSGSGDKASHSWLQSDQHLEPRVVSDVCGDSCVPERNGSESFVGTTALDGVIRVQFASQDLGMLTIGNSGRKSVRMVV